MNGIPAPSVQNGAEERPPWLDDGDIRLYQGDCREVLATLPVQSVQTCVTSPPYWGLRDYGTGDAQIGLESSPGEYVERMVAVFREVRRVLRDDGTVWLNLGDSYASGEVGRVDASQFSNSGGVANRTPLKDGHKHVAGVPRSQRRIEQRTGLKPKDLVGVPWRVAFALQADGWYLRSDIVWSKPNPMPESVTDRPTKAHEYLFLLSKRPRYFYDADAIREASDHPHLAGKLQKVSYHDAGSMRNDGDSIATRTVARNRRSVWTIATEPFPEAHFATYPQALVRPCILAGSRPGDTVFDPFIGSGTTALVARNHGRRCIGIDLSAEYLGIAAKRLQQLSLFSDRPGHSQDTLEPECA
jgi:DNA modification methylase